ncbi:hypothetical protein CTI12_AA577370 [Artemisia annua]|uniref:Uncharacterized protein n=1 Tax=Artemisia annua TaxID=35608 RepID=A0A2U1KQ75_ARTAN|nr:hypothetical protein CTI12_AA577370 [Artemisia annua]
MAAIVSSSSLSVAATWTTTKRLTCSCLTPSNSLGFPSLTTSRRGLITLTATSNDRHLGWLSSSKQQKPPRGTRTLASFLINSTFLPSFLVEMKLALLPDLLPNGVWAEAQIYPT